LASSEVSLEVSPEGPEMAIKLQLSSGRLHTAAVDIYSKHSESAVKVPKMELQADMVKHEPQCGHSLLQDLQRVTSLLDRLRIGAYLSLEG
jgi:hypothetical protein